MNNIMLHNISFSVANFYIYRYKILNQMGELYEMTFDPVY